MPVEGRVEVKGLRELKSALKRVDDDLPKELRLEFREVAIKVAARVSSAVVKGKTGKASRSIKPRASQTGAGVAAGGNAVPYYGFLDFGGSVGPDRRIHRDFIKRGRYLYPTIAAMGDEIEEGADAAMETVVRRAGFETRGEG